MLGVIRSVFDRVMIAGSGRSPKWPAVRRAFIKANPKCVVTGLPAEEVHHVVPFHERPDLELDPNNLRSVTAKSHLIVGHDGNFKKIVTNFDDVVALIRRGTKENGGGE